ncbi:hypothetical protein [Paenibacillus paridis]|uniref:hypothetical protein n=1 Tax=Paenibacillus paridis TaxID=2583376 RepID=UPI00111DF464|nr:hypothetical protein [Paenibacillus paridis]
MSMLKKMICLTLLISVCIVPATAFAASNSESSSNKKSLISSILSIFSNTKSNNNTNNNNHSNSSNAPKPDKDWNSKSWFDWFNHNDNWWDEICWWDKNKDDSYKLWERYYCY